MELDWTAVKALGIRRLTNDSRLVRRGDTFAAWPGETRDGRAYIGEAIARGAGSVLWETEGFRWRSAWRVPNAGVRHLRRHAGEIAGWAYGHPSRALWTVGVTGTNGKTTCSQWIAQLLERAGMRCGIVGTLGHGSPRRLAPLGNTTPDALWLHARLARFAREGVRAVAMEVSSIGLDQDRVAGIEFDVALFTNLTRDHLEYHATMRRYGAAKERLFGAAAPGHAVINVDDGFGRELARRTAQGGVNVVAYGFGSAHGLRAARVAGSNLVTGPDGVRFSVRSPWGSARVASPALGRHNAYNLLATLAVGLVSGVKLRPAVAALSRLAPVPGRMERLGGGVRPLVVIDYAHTPDALEQVLRALREVLARGSRRPDPGSRLVCVFGCGGERDRGKRPEMGRIAARLADRLVVTSDNPRGEDPRRIFNDIVSGVPARGGELAIIPDRASAVRFAVRSAHRGDIVLIAGKGHERYQLVGAARHPYSDLGAAGRALRAGRS